MAVGRSAERVDGPAKVTGRAAYTDDQFFPGMLVAKYLRANIAHGRVIGLDPTEALALPGVEAVFTFEDVPQTLFATAGHPFSLDPDHKDKADRLLLTDRIRFWGDEIAVVVAEDELLAARALKLIRVESEPYEPLIDPEDVLAQGAREIHEGSGNIVGQHSFCLGGDLAEAEESSEVTVSGSYRTQILQHCHLENHTAVGYMDDPDRVVIVSSTQIPHIARRIVSQALDFPLGRIKVVKPYVGGGFGNKQDVVLEPMAAFLTMKMGGRPVKVTLTREECLLATRVRHPFRVEGRAGVSRDGRLNFIQLKPLSTTGGYASHGHSIAAAGSSKAHWLYPRAIYDLEAKTIYANIPNGGAMRGYGSPQITWSLECLVEDLARSAGLDPVEFRLKNVARPGDINQLSGREIKTAGIAECLVQGRELIRWAEKKAEMAAFKTGPIRRGLGVACFSYASGTYPINVESAGARLILNQDGSFHLQVGATEIGQGSDTIFAQMAARVLDLPISAIHVVSTQDTDITPFDSGAYASRQTYVGGRAVSRVAKKMKAKLLAHAGVMLGREVSELDLIGGRIVSDDRALLSLEDLAGDAYYHKDRGGQITAEESAKITTNAPSYGATFVYLEVDIPLCRAKILEILNIHDCGTVINPLLAEGQVHGGQAMAIGAGLYEELLVDSRTGRVWNNNLLDYKVPTIMDIPDLDAAFVETDEPTGPFGAKSLGEPPVLTPAPAIRNAILDATGVAINELPLSPKTLFRHFKAAGLLGGE